jgi:hypothetical protein
MNKEQLRLKIIDRVLHLDTVEELEKLERIALDAICREVDQENKNQNLFDKLKQNADFVKWAEEQVGGK